MARRGLLSHPELVESDTVDRSHRYCETGLGRHPDQGRADRQCQNQTCRLETQQALRLEQSEDAGGREAFRPAEYPRQRQRSGGGAAVAAGAIQVTAKKKPVLDRRQHSEDGEQPPELCQIPSGPARVVNDAGEKPRGRVVETAEDHGVLDGACDPRGVQFSPEGQCSGEDGALARSHDDHHGQGAERTFDPTVDEKRQDRHRTAEDPDEAEDPQQGDRYAGYSSRSRDRQIDAGGPENGKPVADRAQGEAEPVQVAEADGQPQQILQVEQPCDRRPDRHLGEQGERRHGTGEQAQEIPPQGVGLDREDQRQGPQGPGSREHQEQDGEQDRHCHRLVGSPHGVRQCQPRERQQQVRPASGLRQRRHRVLKVALAGSREGCAGTWTGGGPNWPLCTGKTRPPTD